jgi:hypothetical protein
MHDNCVPNSSVDGTSNCASSFGCTSCGRRNRSDGRDLWRRHSPNYWQRRSKREKPSTKNGASGAISS